MFLFLGVVPFVEPPPLRDVPEKSRPGDPERPLWAPLTFGLVKCRFSLILYEKTFNPLVDSSFMHKKYAIPAVLTVAT